MAITRLLLPLAGTETLLFDLNAVYRHTFGGGRWGDLVDYEHEPERFHTYSPADQKYIQDLMNQIQRDSTTSSASGWLMFWVVRACLARKHTGTDEAGLVPTVIGFLWIRCCVDFRSWLFQAGAAAG